MSASPQDELYTIKYIESLPEGQRAELLDGELYDLAAPAVIHQQLIAQLTRVIGNYIDAHNDRYRGFPAPFADKIPARIFDGLYIKPETLM